MNKRHFYECGGQTLSWREEWYTQPWFTTLRQSYDRAASTEAVQPPFEVIQTVDRCSSLLEVERSSMSSAQAAITSARLTTSAVIGSAMSGGDVIPTTRTTVFTVPATASSPLISTSSAISSSFKHSTLPSAGPSIPAVPAGLVFLDEHLCRGLGLASLGNCSEPRLRCDFRHRPMAAMGYSSWQVSRHLLWKILVYPA